MATRKQLNEKAAELGIENPESYPNIPALTEAIEAKENETPVADGEQLESREEAVNSGTDAAASNAGAETVEQEGQLEPAELDGTAELEEEQDAAAERRKAVLHGKATARENIARERAENQAGE